jgi:hypothetical protein
MNLCVNEYHVEIVYSCMLMNSYVYCISMYDYHDDIYLLFMDVSWKKEKLSFVLK